MAQPESLTEIDQLDERLRTHPLSIEAEGRRARLIGLAASGAGLGHRLDGAGDGIRPTRFELADILSRLLDLIAPGLGIGEPADRPAGPDRIIDTVDFIDAHLTDCIERASRIAPFSRTSPIECWDRQRAQTVVVSLFESLAELRAEVASDIRAAYDGDPAASSPAEVILSYPGIVAIAAYRLAHRLWRFRVALLPRMMTEWAHSVTGIDIHPGAWIGREFFIDHGTGVVIGATARIGDRVRLYQGVTLGALSIARNKTTALAERKRHPTIEDGVTIYANAAILGGETKIGRDSVIGASALVMSSVGPNSVVIAAGRAGTGAPSASARDGSGIARKPNVPAA